MDTSGEQIVAESLAGAILTDSEIEELVKSEAILTSFDSSFLSGCSYDLRIGRSVRSRNRSRLFDLTKRDYSFESGECITFETIETINFSQMSLFGIVVNKHSVLARGIVHPITKIDPGYNGTLAITLFNFGNKSETIQYGQPLVSLVIFGLRSKPRKVYGANQKPSYREGSLDIAAIGNEPEDQIDDKGLSKMYGTAVSRLYERVEELEKRLDVGVLLKDKSKKTARADLMWRIAIPLAAAIFAALINQNWTELVKFLKGVFTST